MTGQVWRGQLQTSKGDFKHNVLSWSPNLAKLNPTCHTNYSIIFTEINFYPGTSNLLEFRVVKVLYVHMMLHSPRYLIKEVSHKSCHLQ